MFLIYTQDNTRGPCCGTRKSGVEILQTPQESGEFPTYQISESGPVLRQFDLFDKHIDPVEKDYCDCCDYIRVKIPKRKLVLESVNQSQAQFENSVEMTEATTTEQSNEMAQTVTFVDENLGEAKVYNPITDNAIYTDHLPGADLANFLSRPVLIETITWSIANSPGIKVQLNPWYDYFNNTSIKKKLDNYAFLSCNLKLKFVINASPFYFGSMLMSYEPLYTYRNDPVTPDGFGGEAITYSQRPHVWLMPQTNAGAEMTLPFFYHKNWINCTVAADVTAMGQMTAYIVNALSSANGVATGSVTIQLYAWAEDVKVMGPTAVLALQSQDEYTTDGIISGPASAIATAAGWLSEVPVIGRYMTATSFVATAVGNVAKYFGYTNVPNIDTVAPFRPFTFAHFASASISNPVEKLTIDPKNELSIDPTTVGVPPIDELSIKYLVQRESYIGSSVIDTTNAVNDVIFTANVGNMFVWYTTATSQIYYTPLAYVSSLFRWWRGDIIFRFRFICTKFHKGRVRLTWDPLKAISTTDTYQTNFNQVIDIGDNTDFEIRVPYAQATAWCKTLVNPAILTYASNTTLSDPIVSTHNGQLQMRIVTPLSAPIATSTIRLQIFVRGAENFELAYPADPPQNLSAFIPQSTDEVCIFPNEIRNLVLESLDELCVCNTKQIDMKIPSSALPERYLINMGENVTSLRTILRRTTFFDGIFVTNDNTNKFLIVSSTTGRLPIYYGYDPNGVHTARNQANTLTVPFNWVKVTPYAWVSRMFVGQRGSFIWHINSDTRGAGTVPLQTMRVTMSPGTRNAGQYNVNNTVAVGTASSYYKWQYDAPSLGASGTALTNGWTQTGLSASLPLYQQFKFQFVNPSSAVIGSVNDGSDIDSVRITALFKPSAEPSGSVGSTIIAKYGGIGTDFTFFFFINAPMVWLVNSPVAA